LWNKDGRRGFAAALLAPETRRGKAASSVALQALAGRV